jgi:opacity protein-like surface antigen
MMMNKTFTATVVAAVLSFGAIAASAQTAETPRIDARQAKQEQRIDQGIASGELNKREANRLNHQQNVIDKAENKAKADGVVTGKERKALTRAQNNTSKRIYRQKHDAQERKS